MSDSSLQPAERVLNAPVNSKKYNDCLSCRIVGTGTLGGVGSYAIYQSRAAAPGTPGQKRIVAGLGVALLVGGVIRWFQ
ncbi:hypothetical protein Hypma_008014 [Hypsizygus marmoreus]|uniref:Distal membrane-arm assembly complex protein 1-like domain-containing protein n=1 Tax=Hypsizygus marmoreus TaxID=39966 RepID=A0A369K0J4_HYPMA|nr:hypothetical protein Hypma_008014 [Hypsizygus marmoreus]